MERSISWASETFTPYQNTVFVLHLCERRTEVITPLPILWQRTHRLRWCPRVTQLTTCAPCISAVLLHHLGHFWAIHFSCTSFWAEFLQNSQTQVKVSSLNTQGLLPRDVMVAASIMGLFICGVVCVSVHVWCVGVLYMHSCGRMDSCACKSQMARAPGSVIHSPFYSPETGSVSPWP